MMSHRPHLPTPGVALRRSFSFLWLRQLSFVAAMMLSLPAGESHDEFVFSDTGRTFTEDRPSLDPFALNDYYVHLDRNFEWNPSNCSRCVVEAATVARRYQLSKIHERAAKTLSRSTITCKVNGKIHWYSPSATRSTDWF